MAYFDFVNSGGSAQSYGLVSKGSKVLIDNYSYTDSEYEISYTASGDTHYYVEAVLKIHSAVYVPYCKLLVNGTEVVSLEGTSVIDDTKTKTADVFVKSGDTFTIKLKSWQSSASYLWINEVG